MSIMCIYGLVRIAAMDDPLYTKSFIRATKKWKQALLKPKCGLSSITKESGSKSEDNTIHCVTHEPWYPIELKFRRQTDAEGNALFYMLLENENIRTNDLQKIT